MKKVFCIIYLLFFIVVSASAKDVEYTQKQSQGQNATNIEESQYTFSWFDCFIYDDENEYFKFVKENMVCKILSYKGKVFGVEPPTFVELTVTKTEPGFAGNTATNATKPATLETGCEIRVPLFINEGEVIRIDTRTGEYMERA